jgi:hypothetical protein
VQESGRNKVFRDGSTSAVNAMACRGQTLGSEGAANFPTFVFQGSMPFTSYMRSQLHVQEGLQEYTGHAKRILNRQPIAWWRKPAGLERRRARWYQCSMPTVPECKEA